MNTLRTKNSSARAQKQRGSVFAEFVLVAPFILALAGYGLRFTQELQAQQLALTLSRELATDLFSKCLDITIQQVPPSNSCATALCVDSTKTTAAIQSCMRRIAARYASLWNGMNPSSSGSLELTAEIYRYDIGSFQINSQITCDKDVSDKDVSFLQTKATTSGDEGEEEGEVEIEIKDPVVGKYDREVSYAEVCHRNRVARAKLKFTIKPLTSFLPGASSNDREIIYEATL